MAAVSAYVDPDDARDLARMLRTFSDQEVKKVLSRAGSTAGRKTRTKIVRRIAQLTTLKQKDVRVATSVLKKNDATVLRVKGPPTPLHKYKWGQKGPRNRWGYRLIWVQVWRQKAREDMPYAFPLETTAGTVVLVERKLVNGTRAGRKPLAPIYGPAVPSVLEYTRGELAEATSGGALEFSSEVERQIDLILRKY